MFQSLNSVVTCRVPAMLYQASPMPRCWNGVEVRRPVGQKIGSKIHTAPPSVPAGNSTMYE